MSNEPNSLTPASSEAVSPSFETLREESLPDENLALGVIAGIAAMLVGTAIWVGVTVGTGYQIGYLAVGVGFLVGISMRLGRGYSPIFSVIGATLGLLGCALGNLFTGCVLVAGEVGGTFGTVVSGLDVEMVGQIMGAMFSPIDLLFYALAAMAGWKYAVVNNA
ncbi:MAG: hypothetical protein H7067_06305 [Burkholderiales bacterium]|nr:hypothetical protein [Opitutaceae bacterium]